MLSSLMVKAVLILGNEILISFHFLNTRSIPTFSHNVNPSPFLCLASGHSRQQKRNWQQLFYKLVCLSVKSWRIKTNFHMPCMLSQLLVSSTFKSGLLVLFPLPSFFLPQYDNFLLYSVGLKKNDLGDCIERLKANFVELPDSRN